MSRDERDKWDDRYRQGSYANRPHATALLSEWLPRLPKGRALDVGCGAGRNSLFLAAAGYQVDAVDISQVALDRARQTADSNGLSVEWIQADLDVDALPEGPYDLIVMVRFVNQPLISQLLDRLREGGYLVCEQHLITHREVVGPRNSAYRLRSNELLEIVRDARVLFYHEGIVVDPDSRQAALAQLVACRGKPDF